MNESPDSRQHAATARLARERRIQTLRMRVLAFAVALFLAAWLGLYAQLVSGHDPALAKVATPVATQSADPQVADDWSGGKSSADAATTAADGSDPSSASSPSSDTGSASSAGSGSTSTQSAGTSAVTTRQS